MQVRSVSGLEGASGCGAVEEFDAAEDLDAVEERSTLDGLTGFDRTLLVEIPGCAEMQGMQDCSRATLDFGTARLGCG